MANDDFKITRIRPGQSKKPTIIDQIQAAFKANGGSGFGGGNGSGRPPRKAGEGPNPGLVFGGFVLAVLVVWGIFSSYYTVDISEEGVVTRFGAYHHTSPSGIHFKIPFGIENVTLVQSKKILQEEFGFRTKDTTGERSTYESDNYDVESLMLTGDLNVANVEWILQFRISDSWKYLFHARDVRRNIRDVSMSIMRRVVGDRAVGDVLTTGRVEIADQAKILTQEILDQYDMGIKIEKIILQGVNPPDTVKPAFNEVNAAKQEQEQTINIAEKEYNKIIPEARGKALKFIADAEGYSIDIVNRAKGDASQIREVLTEYKKAPDITRRRLYIETMEKVLESASELTIVDKNLKGVMPIYPMAGK
jgi:membrane protease subunit HflK